MRFQYFLNILCLSEQIWADVICVIRFQHISTYLVLRDFHWGSTPSLPNMTFNRMHLCNHQENPKLLNAS